MSESKGEGPGSSKGDLLARGPEVGVAALLVAIALLVIKDSIRVGIGWADDGPRAGYFPFYIGVILLATSGFVLVTHLLAWRRSTALFAEHAQLRMVVAVLLPMIVYAAAIFGLGIYLASALLIGYFMRRYGKYGWSVTTVVSVAVPLFFFLIFERWFLVPLPKGPIERALGF
jgi:putative tricarboxylic transport membrane protein